MTRAVLMMPQAIIYSPVFGPGLIEAMLLANQRAASLYTIPWSSDRASLKLSRVAWNVRRGRDYSPVFGPGLIEAV